VDFLSKFPLIITKFIELKEKVGEYGFGEDKDVTKTLDVT